MLCSVKDRLQPPRGTAALLPSEQFGLSGALSDHVVKGEPRRRYLLSQMHLGSRAYVLLLHELARSAGATQRPEPAAQGSPLPTGSDEL